MMEEFYSDIEQAGDAVVENSKVAELIEKGKKGQLSAEDYDQALEEINYDTEKIEKLYEDLEDNGVALPGNLSGDELAEFEKEIQAEVSKFDNSANMEKILEQEGLSIDDPVRQYLKEIGRIPLLDFDGEKALAERMIEGDEDAMIGELAENSESMRQILLNDEKSEKTIMNKESMS